MIISLEEESNNFIFVIRSKKVNMDFLWSSSAYNLYSLLRVNYQDEIMIGLVVTLSTNEIVLRISALPSKSLNRVQIKNFII